MTEQEVDAIEGKLLAEIESLREQLKDRESDLRFEYAARINAEAQCEKLQAWKAAVPVESLKNCYALMTPSPADEDAALDWLATLDGAA